MFETAVCIVCKAIFQFGEGCFEFDDGDMCSTCYAEYEKGEADYNELEAQAD